MSRSAGALTEMLEPRQFMSAADAVAIGPLPPPGTTSNATPTTAALPLAGAPALANATTTGLKVTFGPSGIGTVAYNGLTLTNTAANPTDGFQMVDYELIRSDGTNSKAFTGTTSWNAATDTVTVNYAWGSVSVQYTVLSDRINFKVSVANTSKSDTLAGVTVFPLAIRFPAPALQPVGNVRYGTDGPAALLADYGSGSLALCEEDAGHPAYLSLQPWGPLTSDFNGLEMRIGSAPLYNNDPPGTPRFTVPLAPGQSDTYHASLRFAPSGTPIYQIAADVYRNYGNVRPMTLNWTDRRPIGELFPSGSSPSTRSLTNPNGWFNDPNIDVTTPQGLAQFSKRLLQYADSSVATLQQTNAQGVIIWDLEGEEFSSAAYIGDPRLATQLAPELAYNDVIDAFFKKFTDAGLRVGLTVRPTVVKFDKNGPYQAVPADATQTLIDKITYAKNRWGCTLFYLDSTDPAADPMMYKRVLDACPGVLLIPENQSTGDYAYTAPYDEVRMGVTTTPPDVRAVYPNSFSVLMGADAAHAAALQTAVSQGDILLFHAENNDSGGALVKSIYDAANAGKNGANLPSSSLPEPSLPQSSLPAGLLPPLSSGLLPILTGPFSTVPIADDTLLLPLSSATQWLRAA